MWRTLASAALSVALVTMAAVAGDENPSFPNDARITLLLSQAENAFESYRTAILQEQRELPNQGATQDEEVLNRALRYLPKLRKNPQAFNGPAGFLLVIDLDDASRNMAVCTTQAATQANLLFTAGNASGAQAKLLLGQTCMGVSQLTYSVSQTAVATFEEYLLAEDRLRHDSAAALGTCAETLKKMTERPGPK